MTKKILIVDDEPLILFGLSRTFQDLAEVKTVNTGEKACDEVAANFYNLCFLDIYLPGMSGLEVMEQIKERSPETKIVVMSAFVDENMKKRIEKSACMLLEKPFNLSSIKDIVKETLL